MIYDLKIYVSHQDAKSTKKAFNGETLRWREELKKIGFKTLK